MTQTIQSPATPAIPAVLRAGLIAGIVAAILVNAWYYASVAITGRAYEELNVVSLTAAGIMPSLVGSVVYLLLARRTARPALIFRVVGVTLAALSNIPQFVQPLHEGFALVTTPLHMIVGIVVVWLVPVLAPAGSDRTGS